MTEDHKQLGMFKQDVPEMPEGYYSSGPNPNLLQFVEEHSTPYDPDADEYDVPPFDKPINTTKATAIYNMHTYWSKKPHDAVRQYIQHYTGPGDIVLDPFCGSGSTALASLMEERVAIAIDLSPAATFITKNYCTPAETDKVQRTLEKVERKVGPEMEWLFETRCDRCDGKALTSFTVYSQVFQCPRCLEKVALFDCVETEGTTSKGKPKKIRACPSCYKRGNIEEISTRSEKFGAIPVLVSYLCQEGCTPKRNERRHNDRDSKKRAYFETYDLGKIREIEESDIPYWIPSIPMIKGYETTVKRDLEGQGVYLVADMFTKRNLWALALLRSVSIESDYADVFLFALTGISLGMSRMNRYRPEVSYPTNILNGTYYLPQISREDSPLKHFTNKVDRLCKGFDEIKPRLSEATLLIDTRSATHLAEMPPNSIDYIFTDPPYAGKVQYGELNFVWEAWLGFETDWHDKEIIVNEVRGKTDDDWAFMMRQAMTESYRVLKPGRWISLCYHDTSEGTWQLVQDIMAEVGFIPELSDDVLYIDTSQKSYNQLMAEKATRRDLVINFRKPRLNEMHHQLTLFGNEDTATFTDKARAILVEALQTHPGSTSDRLYDELVSRMVRRGEFERHDFETLLHSVAEPVTEAQMANLFEKEPPNLFGTHETVRWYLKANADVIDEAESAKEEAAADRLEAFMQRYLADRPEELGVHYSDLFEQYLPVKDKPRRQLWDWLPEFFFKTAEGTWRPPANEEEREQKAALRTSGALRRIKRFANALLEGVPPSEHDVPANVATAADWLRQCRRAGLYELGRVLYEKGGFDFGQLGEQDQLEVEEDYQICVRRSG